MVLPQSADYVLIGAGIHSLSLAWRLSDLLHARGKAQGKGEASIVILDKSDIGAGASGIACGVVRNNYFQPAMRELMAHSVGVWESDPEAFHYHSVGYMQISPEVMHENVAQIYAEQKAIGYESTFVEGKDNCRRYMKDIVEDWQMEDTTSVLHEKRGGFAHNKASLEGLAKKARAGGVQIIPRCKVTGFQRANGSQAVRAVITDKGTIACEQVVVAVGPWVRDIWAMLELPEKISMPPPRPRKQENNNASPNNASPNNASPNVAPNNVAPNVPMWRYWQLEEGVLQVDPSYQQTNDGETPPVLHVDSAQPLVDKESGKTISENGLLWGIYYKPDRNFGGVQGGGAPYKIDLAAEEVAVDPYGPESPQFTASKDFPDMWCCALATCQQRFEGKRALYLEEPSGGVGCMTPDSFPVFDRFCDNVYVIADSNHGYKMIGVGHLVAEELLGTPSALLEPFRFARYRRGDLHPTSKSPFPWS